MTEIDHGPAVYDRCYGHENPEFDYPKRHGDRVPKTVRLLTSAKSDFPLISVLSVSRGGEYPAWTNRHGAVSAILPSGDKLGLLPHEFEVVAYLDADQTTSAREPVMQRITKQAAQAFMQKHHYLGDVPTAATVCYGNGRSVAVYGPIHAPKMPKDYLELRRLASDGTDILSRFLAQTLKALKAEGVPAVLTWADPAAGHHGGIYQATNWIYTEPRSYNWNSHYRRPDGTVIDHRKAYELFGSSAKKVVLAREPTWEAFLPPMKYRYLMPLNVSVEEAVAATRSLVRPYPKPEREQQLKRYPAAQRAE